MALTRGFVVRLMATTLLLLLQGPSASAFSWRGSSRPQHALSQSVHPASSVTAAQLLKTDNRVASPYEVALNELQELEFEPLCHRTAARLLVTNCQLLEGKDETTVLTDSGRKIRDFVDSYAASLAICDLERGSFTIPRECAKFQEAVLIQMPLQDTANLHVTTREIDVCLSSLATSNSAWNTWVSYRHKALRFCEAARADHDKTQHILLFERLTKIMSTLVDDVDERIESRMHAFDLRAMETEEKLGSLSPQVEKLQQTLTAANAALSGGVIRDIEKSQHLVESSIDATTHLERMLQVLLQGVLSSHAEAAAIHEQSLQAMNKQVATEMEVMASTVVAAVAVTTALQDQIEASLHHTTELQFRQEDLEQGMQRMINISEDLASNYEAHTNLLYHAQNMTDEILGSLGETAASAATVSSAFLKQNSFTSWWPYIWCPAASLVMGSYGLPPSILRNIGLIAFGEAAGFVVASFRSLSFDPIMSDKLNLSPSFFTTFVDDGTTKI
ncbi:hypothetical protein F5Y16DRAFT_374674 [Xylariaceae sp. FL0255]|nr:hypothetical protein F5Y16DRAFT_374674 [Xylariaceae sp. FL0255]